MIFIVKFNTTIKTINHDENKKDFRAGFGNQLDWVGVDRN